MAKRKRHDTTGEISCSLEENGRRITLDPIKQFPLTIMLNEVESTIPCGFRVEWVTGNKDGNEFVMTCGAGCGSKWMTFDYRGKQYTIDSTEIVEAIIDTLDKQQ